MFEVSGLSRGQTLVVKYYNSGIDIHPSLKKTDDEGNQYLEYQFEG